MITITGDTVVRSHIDLFTKDVVWFVDAGISLTFKAPTLTFSRSQVLYDTYQVENIHMM